MPENLYPQLPTAQSISQESFNIEMVRKYYQDIANLKEQYTGKQRKCKNAYNRLLHSGELRPGSKPSSFAYVKTAKISVSACSEYDRSTKITKMMHFDNYSKIYNYQQNNMQIRLRACAFVLNFRSHCRKSVLDRLS